ncbi:PepSY domain-containing protein [Leisingera aquimarina]|uniref:PepSY domain-containing protein n=1 Tax=Leisingera aquimarina TaxID=476529 RepID=UPI0003FAAA82|nr:PepSY domain-containing protein [Leisingera aquimarina]
MPRTSKIFLPAVLLAALPFAASAETMDQSELDMFRSASLTISQAGDAALQAHAGTLAAVAFGGENGRAAYEAVVIGGDGQPWTKKITTAKRTTADRTSPREFRPLPGRVRRPGLVFGKTALHEDSFGRR